MPAIAKGQQQEQEETRSRAFEEYVAQLYEGLGFFVTADNLIEGQKVSIIAKKYLNGIGEILLIVKCKLGTTSSISNQEIYDFIKDVEALRVNLPVTKGIIVTNMSFSASSRIAAGSKIELLTQADLESQLFELKHNYRKLVQLYEQEAIFNEYIPLSGIERSRKQRWPHADTTLSELIDNPSSQETLFFVLGDYGAGKTTLLQRLQYEFARKLLEGSMDLKPLLFELRDFPKYQNLEMFLAAGLKRQFSSEIPLTLFWQEVERGGFLLLLDGFDEMSSQVDSERRISNFLELSRLLIGRSPAFLTCRPAYFVTEDEYVQAINEIRTAQSKIKMQFSRPKTRTVSELNEKVIEVYSDLYNKYIRHTLYTAPDKLNSVTIELESFSEEQVDNYLAKFQSDFLSVCNRSYSDVKKALLAIYDLRDLMSKPILLSMMKDTVLMCGSDFFDHAGVRNPASLYETYTSLNFDLDWSKGPTRQLLTKQQRSNFAEAIALAMYDKGRLEVTYEEIIAVIHENPSILKSADALVNKVSWEQIATDIQLCTFITRTSEDTFKFIHRSFMEFFVARFLKWHLSRRSLNSRYKNTVIPSEILLFIGSFATLDAGIMEGLKTYRKAILFTATSSQSKRNQDNHNIFKRNIFGCILYSTQNHQNMKFGEFRVTSMNLLKTHVAESQFYSTIFDRFLWVDSNLSNVHFADVSFVQSNLDRMRLDRISGSFSMTDSTIKDSHITASELEIQSLDGGLNGGTINNTRLKVSGGVALSNLMVSFSTIFFMADQDSRKVRSSLSSCTLEGAELASVNTGVGRHIVSILDCRLYKCKLAGLEIEIHDVRKWMEECTECMGVLVVRESVKNLSRFWQDQPLGRAGFDWLNDTLLVVLQEPEDDFDVIKLIDRLTGRINNVDAERLKKLLLGINDDLL